MGLRLSVSLKSMESPFAAMVRIPVSVDEPNFTSFHSPATPGPPEIRCDTADMVNGASQGMIEHLWLGLPRCKVRTVTHLRKMMLEDADRQKRNLPV